MNSNTNFDNINFLKRYANPDPFGPFVGNEDDDDDDHNNDLTATEKQLGSPSVSSLSINSTTAPEVIIKTFQSLGVASPTLKQKGMIKDSLHKINQRPSPERRNHKRRVATAIFKQAAEAALGQGEVKEHAAAFSTLRGSESRSSVFAAVSQGVENPLSVLNTPHLELKKVGNRLTGGHLHPEGPLPDNAVSNSINGINWVEWQLETLKKGSTLFPKGMKVEDILNLIQVGNVLSRTENRALKHYTDQNLFVEVCFEKGKYPIFTTAYPLLYFGIYSGDRTHTLYDGCTMSDAQLLDLAKNFPQGLDVRYETDHTFILDIAYPLGGPVKNGIYIEFSRYLFDD